MEERRSEYRAGWTEKEKTSKGETVGGGKGDGVHVRHMAEGMREGKRERNVGRAMQHWRERASIFLFHRTVETRACHGGRVGGEVAAMRARGRRKTRMRLMIYMPATVYYCLERAHPRGYHLFSSFPPFFFSLIVFSRVLSYTIRLSLSLFTFSYGLRPPVFYAVETVYCFPLYFETRKREREKYNVHI